MLNLYNAEHVKRLGERIRSARKDKGITQEQLIELININRSTLSKWENGEQIPGTVVLCDLCRALEIDLGYLFGDYQEKSLDLHYIHKETGLSEKAVKTLVKWHNKPLQPFIWVLNHLIEKKAFSAVLAAIWNYYNNTPEHIEKPGDVNITVETGLPSRKEILLWTASRKFTECIEK